MQCISMSHSVKCNIISEDTNYKVLEVFQICFENSSDDKYGAAMSMNIFQQHFTNY